MGNEQLVQQLNKELAIGLPQAASLEEATAQLSQYINQLIQTNFEQLVNLLYRIDIDESKIKSLLQINTNEDAGDIIAALIIDRQLQKIKCREQFKATGNHLTDEEKW